MQRVKAATRTLLNQTLAPDRQRVKEDDAEIGLQCSPFHNPHRKDITAK